MIKVNKKIEYGVLALLYLDKKEEKAGSVREISSNCGVPEALLSKIMQSMKSVGYVQASYGNQGGYKLAKALSEISLLGITEVLDGPIQVADCLEPGNEVCPAKNSCTIIDPMNVINQKIIQLFQSTSIAQLSSERHLS